MEKELEKESRTQQLYDNWSHETNDPETQESRYVLGDVELILVKTLDRRYLDGFKVIDFDILAKEKENMEKELEKESRTQQLYDNWLHETNDPETQEWRDDLTAEELEQVERWDEGYLDGIEKMAARILEMEEKRERKLAGYQYYRIMRDPEESWQPYKSEPIYDEHPEMGTFRSSCSMPKAGDYLVKTEDGVTVRSADIYPDRVEFSALPPLDELITSGMLVPASKEIMELDIARQHQIEDLRRYMVDLQGYMRDRHSSQGNPENVRNAMEDLQKLQAGIAKREGKLLDLETEYQSFCDENFRVGDAQEPLPERTFITPEAWPSKIVPENAAELAAAFNKSMNEYICKTDLLPQIAEDEIQKQADRLWESYCKTGEIAGVREQKSSVNYLKESAQAYAQTHAQPVQNQTMAERRGKIH